MTFKSALISALLLASSALANLNHMHRRLPSIYQRDGYRHKNVANASAAIISGTGIRSITSTVTLPSLDGNNGGSALATVVIDLGGDCNSGNALAAAILMGPTSYTAGALFFKDEKNAQPFDLTLDGGDRVTITVTATSKTSGKATIENLTKHQGPQTITLAPQSAHNSLCLSTAGIAMGLGDNADGSTAPLLHFGSLTFEKIEFDASSGTLTFDNVPSQDVTLDNMLSGDEKSVLIETSIRHGDAVFKQKK